MSPSARKREALNELATCGCRAQISTARGITLFFKLFTVSLFVPVPSPTPEGHPAEEADSASTESAEKKAIGSASITCVWPNEGVAVGRSRAGSGKGCDGTVGHMESITDTHPNRFRPHGSLQPLMRPESVERLAPPLVRRDRQPRDRIVVGRAVVCAEHPGLLLVCQVGHQCDGTDPRSEGTVTPRCTVDSPTITRPSHRSRGRVLCNARGGRCRGDERHAHPHCRGWEDPQPHG